jgi:hypothetical protein
MVLKKYSQIRLVVSGSNLMNISQNQKEMIVVKVNISGKTGSSARPVHFVVSQSFYIFSLPRCVCRQSAHC